MEKLKIAQVARELGITPAGVYKRLKTDIQLVENHVVKEKGVTYLTREGVETLRETMHKPGSMSDSTSIQLVENPETKHLKEIIANQQRTIESLITQSEEQRKRTDTILMKLTNDISSLQKTLEYKKPEYQQNTLASKTSINTQKEETPRRSTPPIVNPTQKEVSFREGFNQNLKEVQTWLQGVFAPFTEVFKGS